MADQRFRYRFYCCMLVSKRKKFDLLTYSVFFLVFVMICTKKRCVERVLFPRSANSTLNTNPYNLTFIINEPNACADKSDLFIISTVSSSPDHFAHRSTIRRTWGANFSYQKVKLKTLFFVGLSNNWNVMEEIKLESEKYHDIIQVDFVDAYRNMTYKFAAELQWVHRHCSQAKFILKTDDDIFVEIFKVNDYLRDLTNSDKIICSVMKNSIPYRQPGEKWEVKYEEYQCKSYPFYCSGGAVILPMNMTETILDAISRTEFFWIDDVYITGILPKILGIRHKQLGNLAQMFPTNMDKAVRDVIEGRILFLHARNTQAHTVLPLIWEELNKIYSIYKN